jgi:hypothetical protein
MPQIFGIGSKTHRDCWQSFYGRSTHVERPFFTVMESRFTKLLKKTKLDDESLAKAKGKG